MIRGLYTAASGMIYENKRQETIAQNISNVQTPGFKQTYLTAIAQDGNSVANLNGKNQLGNLAMGVKVGESELQFNQGDLIVSENNLDFAIQGEGFFTLQGPNETLYTRDGRFTVNNEGTLVSKEGYPVLVTGANGGLQTVKVSEDVGMSKEGSFVSNGQQYEFAISNLADSNSATMQADGVFSYNGNAGLITDGFEINQGMLEGSNVDPTTVMVDMLAVNNSLQMNAKVLTTLDQTLESTVTEIGRV